MVYRYTHSCESTKFWMLTNYQTARQCWEALPYKVQSQIVRINIASTHADMLVSRLVEVLLFHIFCISFWLLWNRDTHQWNTNFIVIYHINDTSVHIRIVINTPSYKSSKQNVGLIILTVDTSQLPSVSFGLNYYPRL